MKKRSVRVTAIIIAAVLYTSLVTCIGYHLPHPSEKESNLEAAAEALITSYGWEIQEATRAATYDLFRARAYWNGAQLGYSYNLAGIEFDLDALYEGVPDNSDFFYDEIERWPTTVSAYEFFVKNPFDENRRLICDICFYDQQLGIARVYPDTFDLTLDTDQEIEWPRHFGSWALDTPKEEIAAQYQEYMDFLIKYQAR